MQRDYLEQEYGYESVEPSSDVQREVRTRNWSQFIICGLAVFFIVAAVIGALALLGSIAMSAQTPASPAPATPTAAQYRFHDGAYLNDLDATPGAINGLTSAQLCAKSFHTGTVRKVPESTKQKVCRLYGIARADCTGKKYEIDHLISLELGGSNDITNLWPQPYFPKPGAKEKDVVENHLHAQVCSGAMTLPQAQLAISTDWYQVFLDINGALAQAGVGR